MAAASIHQFLTEGHVSARENLLLKEKISDTIFESVEGITQYSRAKMPELPVEERIKTFDEVDLVISEEDAQKESERCLACCLTCYDRETS